MNILEINIYWMKYTKKWNILKIETKHKKLFKFINLLRMSVKIFLLTND